MNKLLITLILILTLTGIASAQTTLVSGTVTDSGGQTWNNAILTFSSQALGQSPVTVPLSATGTYTSLTIPHNAATSLVGDVWQVSVCPPFSYGCFTSNPITISGQAQTINLTPVDINFNVPITPQAVTPISAYADDEITGGWVGFSYYNVTSSSNRVCTTVAAGTCSVWVAAGGGISSQLAPPSQVFSDSFNRADQTGLGTSATGQAWTSTGAQAANVAIQSHRYVLNTGSAGGNAYSFISIPSAPMTVGGKFSFVANGGGSATSITFMFQGDTTNLLTKMIHCIVQRTGGIAVTWWNGASQNNVPQYQSGNGPYSIGTLANDGTVYSIQMTIDGNWLYVLRPDGSIATFYDPNFSVVYSASSPAPGASYQLSYTSSNDSISRWEQTFAYGALASTLNSTLNVVGGINKTSIGTNGPSDGMFNRVGIGTINPKARLHTVQIDNTSEAGWFEASNQHSIIRLKQTAAGSGYGAYIYFDENQTPSLVPYIYSGGNAGDLRFNVGNADRLAFPQGGGANFSTPVQVPSLSTVTNCGVSSASPAACGTAAAGSIAAPVGATTYTVNTTAVTANSQVIIQQDTTTALGTRLAVTCNTTANVPLLTAKVAATSFTFALTAPVTNPACFSYSVLN